MSRNIAVDRVDLFREDDLGVGYGQDVATGERVKFVGDLAMMTRVLHKIVAATAAKQPAPVVDDVPSEMIVGVGRDAQPGPSAHGDQPLH